MCYDDMINGIIRLAARMSVSTCSRPFHTFDFGVFKLYWFVRRRLYSWFTGNLPLSLYLPPSHTTPVFSAHKVKGNEGGKSGKKDKAKEDTSPVSA